MGLGEARSFRGVSLSFLFEGGLLGFVFESFRRVVFFWFP